MRIVVCIVRTGPASRIQSPTFREHPRSRANKPCNPPLHLRHPLLAHPSSRNLPLLSLTPSFLVRSARIRVAAAFPQLVHTNYPFFPQRSSPPSSRVCRQPGEARFLSLPLSTSLSTFSCKDIAAMAVVDEDHPILFFAINLRLFLPFSLSSSDGFSFSLAHSPLISFCFYDHRANTP